MSPRVVLFTRYPEPGRAKTRLISALGEDGAAQLHRALTERTIAAMQATGLALEVRTTGAPVARFVDWLGPLAIVDQGEGSLGDRLARAADPYPTIFIGADAPDLTPVLLHNAAAALVQARATIGPAADGGYWLLGLREAVAGVFEGIEWGTERVFAQTMTRLGNSGIAPIVLPELADCDRPEDLLRWPGLVR